MPEINIAQVSLQRFTTIDTKGGGFAILLTTTNNVSDEALVHLMRARGSSFSLKLEGLQQSLLEGDDPNAGVPPTTERVWESTSGDMVRAHAFQSSGPEGLCDHCGHATSHDAHQGISELGDKLIASLEGSENDATQAAVERLKTTSGRNRRNGGDPEPPAA